MYKATEKQAYTLEEVAKILGMEGNRQTDILRKQIQEGTFPFPVLQIRSRYFVSKQAVDDFVKGNKSCRYNQAYNKETRGRPKRWIPSDTVNYNYPIPKELHNKFNKVCEGINKNLPNPLPKGDVLRLAIEEFIDRRPEFLEDN